MFSKEISREELNELPLSGYKGKVVIVNRKDQFQNALSEIHEHKIVGFDTETRPTFRKGQPRHPVALLQVAIPDKVFLFRLNQLGFGRELGQYFGNSGIKKVGIGTRDDIIDLQKLHAFEPSSIVDLNHVAKELEVKNAGARKLSAIFLGIRISKSAQISNWENEQLSEKQVRYAATDAWICLEIYRKLAFKGYI
ncbi:3'-5' exonuclease [Xanthovirga aplysinae]|uniref:3'-5' exonuclease n=1 Tax=Xanthovirga aplysinae TaxID=2529853 RepID=UPI0012BC1ECC|nr:3'-5' exonuclease [Xanthovirga aplysinae]MTI30518.1 3'-5' exonuclease domain-containing protein 2 [Xanthovirga aplysinae]